MDADSTELNKQVNELKTANEQTKEQCDEKCKTKCKELENKVFLAEVYLRRENLQFCRIHESGEQETGEVLSACLQNFLKIDATIIELQCVHVLELQVPQIIDYGI